MLLIFVLSDSLPSIMSAQWYNFYEEGIYMGIHYAQWYNFYEGGICMGIHYAQK
jgi:hypothetical protein